VEPNKPDLLSRIVQKQESSQTTNVLDLSSTVGKRVFGLTNENSMGSSPVFAGHNLSAEFEQVSTPEPKERGEQVTATN